MKGAGWVGKHNNCVNSGAEMAQTFSYETERRFPCRRKTKVTFNQIDNRLTGQREVEKITSIGLVESVK